MSLLVILHSAQQAVFLSTITSHIVIIYKKLSVKVVCFEMRTTMLKYLKEMPLAFI